MEGRPLVAMVKRMLAEEGEEWIQTPCGDMIRKNETHEGCIQCWIECAGPIEEIE